MLTGVAVILVLAWCVAALLPRASAAFRHMIWTCAFAAVLLLAPLRWRAPHRVIAPALPSLPAIAAIATTTAAARPAARRFTIDPSTILLGLWALGSAAMTLRLIRNAIRLRSIVKAAHGVSPILTSSRVRGPLAAGLWRPVILLPTSADTWTVSRRRAVLAHEAAHIRRHDPAILLAAQIATALYWFHPLCWFAAARLRAESERACDDAALGIGLRPSGYAGHLLELACRFDNQLAIPMATTSHLESRVKSILDPTTNRSAPRRAVWFAAIALTAAVLGPLATLTLRAQQSVETVTGIVTDPSGARVPNARVTARNIDTGERQSAVTNALGSYTFSAVPAGHYEVEVLAPGFAPFRVDYPGVAGGGTLQADAHLIIGGLNESVTVTEAGTPRSRLSDNGAAGPVRVGGNIQAARLTRQVSPIYPEDLQTLGIEGRVLLAAIVSKEGLVSSMKVLEDGGNDEFVAATMEAVKQWRYQPTLLNGEPVDVLTTIQMDFKLSALAPVIDDRVLPAKVPVIDDRLLKFR